MKNFAVIYLVDISQVGFLPTSLPLSQPGTCAVLQAVLRGPVT